MTDLTVNAETDEAGVLYGGKTASDLQTNVAVANGKVTGTLKFIEGGLAETGPLAGDGYFLALKWSSIDAHATSLKVGLRPSMGTGLVECLSDPDHNGVFKIADPGTQKFETLLSDGTHRNIQFFDLSGLKLQQES